MPAQSPTLSPTLSAITAGLRGSSSGMPASILPTRSAPTSAAFVKMPPPSRAKTEISEPPNASPMRSSTADSGLFPIAPGEEPVVAGDAEEPEADDEQAGDRAGAERDLERRGDALAGRLGRAHVRAHGDVHADEAGRGREHRADQEADRGSPAELVVEAEQQERHDRDDRDRRVLLAEVRGRALLDGAGDLPHPLVARRLLEQPPGQVEAVQDRDAGADEREQDGMVNEEIHQSSG